MHFLSEYGLFLAKAITLALTMLAVVGGILLLINKSKQQEKTGKLIIQKINNKFTDYQDVINQASQTSEQKKQTRKNHKEQLKKEKHQIKNRLFLLCFQGDIRASTVNSLREEITAILLSHTSGDEILLRIDSPGGLVNAYGLAAAQLQRIKDAKIKLTIAIDKIAASGGYLMACVADHLIAAPFAIIGSIGVIAQLPNFHRLLEKNAVDFEQIYAGQYKRTLTLLGKNTDEGRKKLQEEVNDAHELFKDFIQRFRPFVEIERVATGEHWFAKQAIDLKLIDELKTSDDFLLSAKDQYDIYQVKYEVKRSINQRISLAAHTLLHRLFYASP